MDSQQAVKAEEIWQELQADLASLSTNNRMLAADNSGHRIQVDQPEIVVKAIVDMVESIRIT